MTHSGTGPVRAAGGGWLTIIGFATVLALLYVLRDIIVPLVVGAVLLVLVQALVRAIGDRSRALPEWLVPVVAGVILVGAVAGASYFLIEGLVALAHQGPALIARIDALLAEVGGLLNLHEPLRMSALVGQVQLPRLAAALLTSVQGLLSDALLVILYFVFMLAERATIGRKVRNIARTRSQSATILQVLEQVGADIETYVWIQTLTGLMLAGTSGLIMVAVGLDNALFWTLVLFLLSFIPLLGVTVGSIAPALFALLQFPTLWQAAVIFLGIQVVAFVIGNLLYPRMQADSQNISPVATLFSLAFWTFLWGIPGAFLSVPLTLLVMLVCAKFDGTRWVAILLSNDGAPKSVLPGTSRAGAPLADAAAPGAIARHD